MRLLVTSAAGANGDGYGALLAFDDDGGAHGSFSDDLRIADPRGLGVENDAGLLFVNSGADRVLALDARGAVVRDTGPIEGLNPGGGVFGPDRRYYVGLREDEVVDFDLTTGACLGAVVRFPRPNGQAVALF